MRRITLLSALATAALLLAAAPAGAAYVTIPGLKVPGTPAALNTVHYATYGPASAKTVLVMVPGTNAGAGSVAPVSRDLVARVKGLQVWAQDRREEGLEDHTGFASGDPAAAAAYYLGFTFRNVLDKDAAYAAEWGLNTQLEDLRRVVKKASAGGKRRVILGGHSRGAMTVVAYAAWDFAGTPGFRDLDGLVILDGGLLGGTSSGTTKQLPLSEVKQRLATIRKPTKGGDEFIDPIGIGIPSVGPIFLELSSLFALRQPDAPSTLQNEAIIPAGLKPTVPVTNKAFLGSLFDKDSSKLGASLNVNAGALATTGDPRGWVDGQATDIMTFASAFGGEKPDGSEWYYPQRLVLDLAVANTMRKDAASDLLGLRLWHTKKIDVPTYAFQTDLTNGRVLASAKRLVKTSRITNPKLVSDEDVSHLDPAVGRPEENTFLQTLAPWIERLR